MKKPIAILVGGTGQFGITLSKELFKKKTRVIITTRSIKRVKKKIGKSKFKYEKLNVLNVKQIKKLLFKYKPEIIFYLAGQSSPGKSFYAKKETHQSNFIGCKNFLNILKNNKIESKFINFSSCEIYGDYKKKIDTESKKNPISPYGLAKLKSHNETKKYRNKYNLKSYNAIIFNTESIYRPKNYLIPKICIAAINAKKNNLKTKFGNTNIIREWNWCEEQCKYLLKFIEKQPQDFILSNGKFFSANQMLKFAFEFFKLNYKNFVTIDKKFIRKADSKIKKSNFMVCLRKNKIKRINKIYGKKLIYKIIRHYLNEKKH
tara:strand:- start:1897 stop:2850 length:954 start_codon:yes stop_codon:yes gene_type:complete